MYRGKVIALGTPAELKRQHQRASMEEVFIQAIETEEARTQ
jgi:ABC-type Na+ transport system ATPase subunit NatA